MDERLVKAAREGDVNTLNNLLEEDDEILERTCSVNFSDSPLHVAALYGRAEFVEQMVSLMPSLATETNQKGMIPLHLASSKNHVETVRELLKAKLGDGVSNQCLVRDHEGWTPLHFASQKGKISVIKELIMACPESLKQVTTKGETVLHLAVKANQFEAVKVLADITRRRNSHMLFKARDQNGKSAYQLAVAKKELKVVEVLKEGDGIRDKRSIEVESDKSNNKWQSQDEAILVVAALIIALTYQALANPPSTFLKDGKTSIDWGCLSKNHRLQGGINRLKECPAILALVFMIFNSLVFHQTIFLVVSTLRGPNVFSVRLLTLLLMLCYGTLLMAFCRYTLYVALPYAALVIINFILTKEVPDPQEFTIPPLDWMEMLSTERGTRHSIKQIISAFISALKNLGYVQYERLKNLGYVRYERLKNLGSVPYEILKNLGSVWYERLKN